MSIEQKNGVLFTIFNIFPIYNKGILYKRKSNK